jgi:outer membrane protein TolC
LRRLTRFIIPCVAAASLLLAEDPARRGVRATGVIRAVRSITIQVPRIAGLGGNLTLVSVIRNGTVVSSGDAIAGFDRTNDLKLLQEAQTKLDDLEHQIEQKKAEQISNAEKRTSDLQQSEARLSALLASAGAQYWDAVRARDNIKVLQATYELAQKSYERDKQALDLGALATLDIYQSETQLAERHRDLVQSQYSYQAALDGLRQAIGADLTPELRATELVLDDAPSSLPPTTSILPYEQALAAALRTRPDMDAAQRRVAIDDLNARVARNLLLPRLDLTVQAQTAGLAGNQVAIVGPLGITTPAVSGGLGNALTQVLGFNYPTYGAGLQLTFPLRNSAAQAQLSDALVNKVRDRYTERQVQQQIIQDVRQALNSIELANATIEAALSARDLAAKNVEAEQQKYELGSITAFELLDSQTRLASAESALLNSYVAYQQAFSAIRRPLGLYWTVWEWCLKARS